jgi:NDP-sugar pyrophosphorylase family protein
MSTVVFADRDGESLGPLSEKIVPGLLPLSGIPLLERTLEALFSAGIRTAFLVVGPRAADLEKRFGKGIRWGIALEYLRREAGESCGDVLRRLEQRLDGETLVVRGDVGTESALAEFRGKTHGRTEGVLAAVSGKRPLGIWRIRPDVLKKTELPREPGSADWALAPDHGTVPIEDASLPIDSLAAFWEADRTGTTAIGPRSAAPKESLAGASTVGEESVVLEGARLSGVTVLPRTVVPGCVRLADAVVSQNLVVNARTGATSLLTDLLPSRGETAPPSTGSRLAGVVLLALSLPLWLVAFVWALIANAGHATRPYSFSGNAPEQGGEKKGGTAPGMIERETVKTFRFETAVPVLRDLPMLLSVASGRIALAGMAPLAPEEEAALGEAWHEVRREAPVGLLARARMVTPPSAPAEVARVVDAFDARTGCRGLVGLGLSTFLSERAWAAPKVWNPDQLQEEGKS